MFSLYLTPSVDNETRYVDNNMYLFNLFIYSWYPNQIQFYEDKICVIKYYLYGNKFSWGEIYVQLAFV